ncbi:hypothetical protein FCJ60_06545 [Burkholderia metallica]|nr:hypothetical protein [Burkholderia metallica]
MHIGAGPARRRARSRTPKSESNARYSAITRVAGIDAVEYRAALDVRERTALTIVRLLANVIGTRAPRRAAPRRAGGFTD